MMHLQVAVSCPRPTGRQYCHLHCPVKDREGQRRIWEAGHFCFCRFGQSTAWGLGFPQLAQQSLPE